MKNITLLVMLFCGISSVTIAQTKKEIIANQTVTIDSLLTVVSKKEQEINLFKANLDTTNSKLLRYKEYNKEKRKKLREYRDSIALLKSTIVNINQELEQIKENTGRSPIITVKAKLTKIEEGGSGNEYSFHIGDVDYGYDVLFFPSDGEQLSVVGGEPSNYGKYFNLKYSMVIQDYVNDIGDIAPRFIKQFISAELIK